MQEKFLAKKKINWPPDYKSIFQEKENRYDYIVNEEYQRFSWLYYSQNPVDFIEHWCLTYDPRNVSKGLPTSMPFVLFDKQKELVLWFNGLIKNQENGLIEKSRDMGATWCACAFSVWLWIFHPGSSVGWGSRKQDLVDRMGDPDSIFEKIRMLIHGLPDFLIPEGLNSKEHLNFMKCVHPTNGSTITGEAGDNIGRGGRKLIYFKDESSHYERAQLIEAALADNTNSQVDISSVNGAGNVFYRRRHSGIVSVFVMDWRDHPAKTQDWYDKRKIKAESEGLDHIFAQEVDRDYTSAVEGILIPAKYVNAAIDAHIKLDFEPFGSKKTGLDVADEGGDRNALIYAYGPVIMHIDEWKQGDTSFTAKKGYDYSQEVQSDEMVYDSVGVGAGVKAKTNELNDSKAKEERLKVTPFNAGDGVVEPNKQYRPGKKNKDMFFNIKAQGWWALRDRFLKTYNTIEGIEKYPPEELISLPSNLPHINELKLELSRPLRETDESGRIRVESKAKMKKRGVPSPNLADALVMCYTPTHKPREKRVMIL